MESGKEELGAPDESEGEEDKSPEFKMALAEPDIAEDDPIEPEEEDIRFEEEGDEERREFPPI